MYNRYIPQPDGSYRRNRMPEPPHPRHPEPQPPPKPSPEPSRPEQAKPQSCAPQRRPYHQQRPQRPLQPPTDTSVGSFLKRLLPKDFDTGDLMIVLLLLLMAGDCQDDQNTALLTLALYFFM